MGPIRGPRKRRRADRRAEREAMAPSLHTGDWWDEFSKRITGLFLSWLIDLVCSVCSSDQWNLMVSLHGSLCFAIDTRLLLLGLLILAL